MSDLKIINVNKIYPNGYQAVKDFNMNIYNGEFISLLGTSGCGKSTTLRMIAGLEEISSGELWIGDKLSNNISPKDRKIAMVFQSYALFPHMTVAANIGFGLKIRKENEDVKKKKIQWAVDLLDLQGMEDRKPSQLSGGQRQRVALGRALVLDPSVLLLDEPLSNLDAKLRIKMRTELKRIHKDLKATIIYVTHDQAEAMTLSDRIAIMNEGRIVQMANPTEIYNHPADKFVAGFIGSPPMNFIAGQLSNEGDTYFFNAPCGKISLLKTGQMVEYISRLKSKDVVLGIRPEDMELSDVQCENSLAGTTIVTETLGSDDFVAISLDGQKELLSARLVPNSQIPLDKKFYFKSKGNLYVFDK